MSEKKIEQLEAALAQCHALLDRAEKERTEARQDVAELKERLSIAETTHCAELERCRKELLASCDGSCDIALARRQVGPDGVVPGNARECAELCEQDAARLRRELAECIDRNDREAAVRDALGAELERERKALDRETKRADAASCELGATQAKLERCRKELRGANSHLDGLVIQLAAERQARQEAEATAVRLRNAAKTAHVVLVEVAESGLCDSWLHNPRESLTEAARDAAAGLWAELREEGQEPAQPEDGAPPLPGVQRAKNKADREAHEKHRSEP